MIDDMQDTNSPTVIIEQKSSIKIAKNSKGYNWEIKITEGATTQELENIKQRLEEANNWAIEKFGGLE